jgi:hypothetical protein
MGDAYVNVLCPISLGFLFLNKARTVPSMTWGEQGVDNIVSGEWMREKGEEIYA